MKKILFLASTALCFFYLVTFIPVGKAQAQTTDTTPEINDTYTTATVVEVVSEKKIFIDEKNFYIQELLIKLNDTQELKELTVGSEFQPLNESQRLQLGSTIVVSEQQYTETETALVLNDIYRIPVLFILAVGFGILVIVVGGRKGAFSIAGMVFSLFVLVSFIVPHILAGENPFFVTMVGATVTSVVIMYVSHGFKRQTHLALVSMLLCLLFAALLSSWAVQFGNLLGLGSEEALFLQFGSAENINLQGLLLAGILLGVLGILDDITLSQTAVIEQLKAVNSKISFIELYTRSLEVGKDHVASLVNTLVFAYAGTSLPLFLLFTLYRTQPAWVVINSELIAEELVRTLVGSMALVLAVPITSLIAAYWVTKRGGVLKSGKQVAPHVH